MPSSGIRTSNTQFPPQNLIEHPPETPFGLRSLRPIPPYFGRPPHPPRFQVARRRIRHRKIHPTKTRRIRRKTAQELTFTAITFVPILPLFPITEPLQITVSWRRLIHSKIEPFRHPPARRGKSNVRRHRRTVHLQRKHGFIKNSGGKSAQNSSFGPLWAPSSIPIPSNWVFAGFSGA